MNLGINLFGKKKATDGTEQKKIDAEKYTQEKLSEFSRGLVTIQDIIAPEAIEVDFTYQKINSVYTRTLFVAGYPRAVPANWLSPLINYPHQANISMFIFPSDTGDILDDLKRKITEMEAEITSDIRSGKISNINTEIKLSDARAMREQLAAGSERFFQFGLYITIRADDKDSLDKITKSVQSTLGALMIVSKKSALQMDEGFKTTLPMGVDRLSVTRNMDTTSLATTFPFTSSELTMETGIVYGINEHNDSLVIFDRFKMENANMVIFAKSGAGKSYTVKLEILRQLMFDTEIIVLDPEHEYEELCKMVGGEYINFTFGSKTKINPFDLSNVYEEGENELGQKILSIHGLLKIMLGEMTPQQEAILDRSIIAAYKAKGITPDPATQKNTPPLMEDLYKALIGMERDESDDIAARLEKFITGSFRGIFDQASNIDIRSQFTVFSVKEMEDALRPIAMYVILDFIWTRIKKNLKKRILVIDEAWYFMMHPDSASFVYSMVKRARKYYLGITTITQDVEDFLHNDYGKAIVSNSSIQFLMKQSTASIPILTQTFYLSEGERQLLVSSDIGEGIFFAGQNHVALRVIASEEEHKVITTNPEEILKRKDEQETKKAMNAGAQPRTDSFENYKKTRELRKQRLINDAAFRNLKKDDQEKTANKLDWQKPKVEIEADPLENADSIAENALKTDALTFNTDEELKKREQIKQNQPDTEESQSSNKNQDETQAENFKIKTVFAEPEQEELKPDQHGVYSIDDYSPPK